jgi:hypothetical protein
MVCRDVRVLWLLWQISVPQWRVRCVEGELGARPVSSSRGFRIIGPMQTLVSSSDSISISLPLFFSNSNTSLSMYLFCNSKIHVITLYSDHVYVHYASMLQCWHLVWFLVMTDHHCLGVGCHNRLICYQSMKLMSRSELIYPIIIDTDLVLTYSIVFQWILGDALAGFRVEPNHRWWYLLSCKNF